MLPIRGIALLELYGAGSDGVKLEIRAHLPHVLQARYSIADSRAMGNETAVESLTELSKYETALGGDIIRTGAGPNARDNTNVVNHRVRLLDSICSVYRVLGHIDSGCTDQ